MNKRAITLAFIIGTLGSAASAENTNSGDSSRLTLAMATSTETRWTKFAKPIKAHLPGSNIDLKISERMEKLTADINSQMESKLARKTSYAPE